MIFALGYEFPKATVIAKTPVDAFRAWLYDRWQWLAPRAVPLFVAALGMILVLVSTDYLAHFHGDPSAHYSIRIVGP